MHAGTQLLEAAHRFRSGLRHKRLLSSYFLAARRTSRIRCFGLLTHGWTGTILHKTVNEAAAGQGGQTGLNTTKSWGSESIKRNVHKIGTLAEREGLKTTAGAPRPQAMGTGRTSSAATVVRIPSSSTKLTGAIPQRTGPDASLPCYIGVQGQATFVIRWTVSVNDYCDRCSVGTGYVRTDCAGDDRGADYGDCVDDGGCGSDHKGNNSIDKEGGDGRQRNCRGVAGYDH
ncbi:hypothetical protein FISHEDRAFT_56882 [Fistulina hepatica ATCC 64428]|uniref:Uncharacterized protein n=1 Tax=Fistulina hepatica ATCC 64428 TaxID=1128425 RepID=A0A0D7AKT0_9AGAR|nr:hypothetical protein FISHEDRAFT_56882 [Fistulina hepatica ATCC 64428]